MSNPNWQKGGQSPNPWGRPKKKSQRSVAGMVERFVKKNITPNKMQQMYDKLTDRERLTLLVDLLPYVMSKKPVGVEMSIDKLPDDQLDALYTDVISAISIPPILTLPQKETPGISQIEGLEAMPDIKEPELTINHKTNDNDRQNESDD